MDFDPKNVRVVIGRTKSGGVHVSADVESPPTPSDASADASASASASATDDPITTGEPPAFPTEAYDNGPTAYAWASVLARSRQADLRSWEFDSGGALTMCTSIQAYRDAVAEALDGARLDGVPILTSRYPVARLNDLGPITLERNTVDEHRVCLAFDDPLCVAAAELLATFSGRRLDIVAASEWRRRLLTELSSRDTASTALVMPYWEPNGSLNEVWLAIATRALTDVTTPDFSPSVGILTGPDPGALTIAIAKALLSVHLADRYKTRPGLSLRVDEREGDPSPVLPWNPDSQTGLCSFLGRSDLDENVMLNHDFSAVFMFGHGVSYCSCQGFICAGRPPELEPESEVASCLFGLDCVRPRSIDVRRYNTPVMVISSCGAGNPETGLSDAGIPPISLLASSAAPLMVISSRYNITASSVAETQMIAALAGSASAGDALSRLNRLRRQANFPGDFYLLGDPDLSSSVWYDGSWAEVVTATGGDSPDEWRAHLERIESPYICVRIDDVPEGTWFVWQHEGHLGFGPAAVLMCDGTTELWLAAPQNSLRLNVACRPRATLPSGLPESAETIGLDGIWWQGPLADELPRIVEAGRDVLDWQRTQRMNEGIVRWSPAEDEESMSNAVSTWVKAQLSCLEAIVENREHKLWPWELTGKTSSDVTMRQEACPWCGREPMVCHRYYVTSTIERELLDCSHCDLVIDRPVQQSIKTKIEVQSSAVFPRPVSLVVDIENVESDATAIGAASAFVAESAPLSSVPEAWSFKLEPLEKHTRTIIFEFEGAPLKLKRYGVRVIALVNNRLYWFGRRIVITDEAHADAATWPA